MSTLSQNKYETGDRLGPYVILERVADFSTHTSYYAVETALDRHIFLKVFKGPYSSDPAQRAKFKDHAIKLVELHHKHIGQSQIVAMENDFYYLAGVYVRGYTLGDWLNDERLFDEELALWFMAQVVEALEYASQFGVLDLSIKPTSFVVDWDDIVMAVNLGVTQCHLLLTGSEKIDCLGSPNYVAPEQIWGKPVDIRTDMYSLGAVLFHLMTGRLPFEGETADVICRAHLETPFPAEVAMDANVPFPWVELMGRLMEKNPADRFSSYAELSEALAKLE